ncbi:MAG: M15 family metallopeptidase [Defluviitaleaceae bacterium]|nr:M15 family metallopeptidase [Defluviitaleaceae bacterium]
MVLIIFSLGAPGAVFAETAHGFEDTCRLRHKASVSDEGLENSVRFAASDSDFLHLVNRENLLPADYRPDDLVRFQGIELREPARDAFGEMLEAMESEGIYGLRLQSAYRCFTHQRAVFEDKVRLTMAKGHGREEATQIASQSVQPPGASEHQLGLALDVSINGQLTGAFAHTEAGKWLAENCHYFGFIVRYPQGKSDVTRIIYEPWHLRFVGVPHAQILYENGITLEEYRGFLARHYMYVVWDRDGYFLVQLWGDDVRVEKKQN